MASNTVAPTARELRLSLIFDEIGSLANSTVALLGRLDLDDWNPQADGLRCMAQTIGALADFGIKLSNSGAPQVVGTADDWLGLPNFSFPGEEVSHG